MSPGARSSLSVRRAPALGTLFLVFLVAVALLLLAQALVRRTFAGVNHPVTLNEANAEADPAVVRGWYQQLMEQGTYLQMVRTEVVDLLFAVALGLAVTAFVRLLGVALVPAHERIGRFLFAWAPAFALSAPVDLVENAFSLAMLTDPLDFPDWWAGAHAALSVVKYAFAIASPVVGFSLAGVALFLRAQARKAA